MPNTTREDPRRSPARRARRVLPALALCVALLGAGACSSGDSKDDKGGKGPGDGKSTARAKDPGGDAPKTSKAVVTVTPQDGATGVATDGALKVTATAGKLTEVVVKTAEGTAVEGAIAPDGASWAPSAALQTGMKYAVSASATDAAGLVSAMQSSFTTLTPANTNYGYFNIDANETYGVGMIVSLTFGKAVTDTALVNRSVTVTSEPAVEIKGHWFKENTRLDFRPEKYWRPGTKVTLRLDLDGKQTSPGVYGKQKKTVTFTVGRAQTSVADSKAHTLTVTRDGALLKKLPASLGSDEFTTYNGKMLIMAKEGTIRMSGQSVGFGADSYDIPDVPHSMRLSTSGTYVHGNHWFKDKANPPFGRSNTSHGCVGLEDVVGGGDAGKPGAWFYANSLVGDVVEVINSPERVIDADNGWSGWTLTWAQWTKV
ncbi:MULTISPECIES: Ig-like domain-containing protein [unclassified Embleya]|uniref:L,D-transpeptidase n=1 Tax=unclassified Embleya TaxID=2699296 RepID=UPI0033CC8F48